MNAIKPPRSARRGAPVALEYAGSMRWFHWAIIALSISLTLVAWRYSVDQHRAKVQVQFDRQADQIVELVRDRMRKYEDALWSGVAFINSNDGVMDDQSWNRYARSIRIESKYPGINGIGLITRVRRDAKDELVRTICQDRPSFRIHPERQDEEYLPITSIVPFRGNEAALGLDMMHEAHRSHAAEASRDTADASVTAPIVLVQDDQHTPGFLFFAPVYRGDVPSTVKSRRDSFLGLVYAPFVFKKLMEGTLDRTRRTVGVSVSDAQATLYSEHVKGQPDYDPEPLLHKTVTMPFYGRTWSFDLRSKQSFRSEFDSGQPTFILIAGFLIDGLLIGLFVLMSRASVFAMQLAKTMNADLEKLSLAAKANQIGIWDFDPVSGSLQWDDQMFHLYGCQREDFPGAYEAWTSRLHPDDRWKSEAAWRVAIHGGSAFDCEFRIIRPDGGVRHISAKAKVFRDVRGNAVRMLGANTDVTERRIVATELESARRFQRTILDMAGVAIVATDLDGVIVTFNNAAEKMLGYSRQEILNKQTPGIFHDPDEVIARADELTLKLNRKIDPGFEVFIANLREGETEQREWIYVRKDGTRFPVLLHVTVLQDEEGSVCGYLGIAADLSERKQALANLENANALLARSNEELAQFAYVASHDLQEPLRKVTSFCELLEEDCGDQLSGDAKRYMNYITDGGHRMRTLIQDLLSYSRIESANREREIVDTHSTLLLVLENLSESIGECQAQIDVDELPHVLGDPTNVMQLFQNLIGNAIKYRSEESPRVWVHGIVQGDVCQFAVEDNGIGIDAIYRQQIFGIFKRLHTRSEYGGTGIGLAICKRIVDRDGGRIWVEDSELGGSKFCFELPLASRSKSSSSRPDTLVTCSA